MHSQLHKHWYPSYTPQRHIGKMITEESIYEGFWVNWTDGLYRGSTLTLDKRTAASLIAFLALYVTLTGTHFWQLLCWITFRLRSACDHPMPQDDPLQTLLRNSESSTAATIDFGYALWQWRRQAQRRNLLRTTIGVHASAVIIMVGFFAASIFSSKITNTRSDVLLRQDTCGYWTKLAKSDDDYGDNIVRVSDWEGQRSVNWADSSLLTQYCARHGELSTCVAPGRAFVRWNSSMHGDCPFTDISCASQTLVLDSGLVDSSHHLGINAPKRDRVAFRKQLTCSPINAENRTRKYAQNNYTQLWPPEMTSNSDESILAWLEPEIFNPNRSQIYNGSLFDAIFLGASNFDLGMEATFVQNEALWMNYHSGRTKGSGEAYGVQVQQHVPGGPEALDKSYNRFVPTAGLSRNQSTTLLMFLMNGYTYSAGPVHDPWFKTTNSHTIPHITYSGATYETWFAEYDTIGTLACFEDDEICNPALGICSPVNPYGSSLSGDLTELLRLNEKQGSTLRRVTDALAKSAFGDMVVELNGASMLARRRSFDNTGSSLPANQWVLELQQWVSTSLVATEIAAKQFVTGYGNEAYNRYVRPPTAVESWMCQNQVTTSTAYSSFSVLGLGIIVALGALIVLTNMFIEPIMLRLPGTTKWATKQKVISTAWRMSELLALHDSIHSAEKTHSKCNSRDRCTSSCGSYTSDSVVKTE
ncbi:hypothetical protein CB0940_04186 [Cercospora beticola]|uniref:Uncharacterized protein n=2 Tax=Cercospora beticola TaxID=122368 RepID=A0A2G5HMX0_CERBT|nr:hypothetical protein CB0940_04186 [Cercospora beticola]PIA93909.1 hypothetical protein CB0940_04186 [Cercospora beticola]